MPNLELVQKRDLSSFRRIAIGTWTTAYDPSVYGSMDVRVDEANRYIKEFRDKTGRRLTLTHIMAKAAGAVFETMPDANAIIRRNKIYLRKKIGAFFQVAMEDQETGEIDLSGVTVHDPEQKSIMEVVDEFEQAAQRVRAGKDKELEGTRSTFKKIPYRMLNFVLKMISYFAYTLNWNMKWAGVPKDAFGSIMITNIGSLKLERAFVPLVPYSRVPLLIAMGAVTEKAIVDNGEIVIGKMMTLGATFDHRVLDGVHLAHMAKTVRAWFEQPYEHLGAIDDLPGLEETASAAQAEQEEAAAPA